MRFPKLPWSHDKRGTLGHVNISLVTSLVLVCMVLALAWGRDAHNRNAEALDGARLRAAVESEIQAQGAQLESSVTDMIEGRPPANAAQRLFSGIFLVDLDNGGTALALPPFSPPAGFEHLRTPLAAVLNRAREDMPPGLRGGVGADGAVATAKTLGPINSLAFGDVAGYAVSIVPLSEAGKRALPLRDADKRPLVALASRTIADSLMSRVAAQAGVATLLLAPRPSREAGVSSAPVGAGGETAYVEWRADNPGDRMLGGVGAILVSVGAALAGLLAYRSTSQLASAETVALKLAGQDALSGIANRLLFTRVLDNSIGLARREGRGFALLYIDLDRFKAVNDDFGHDAGDKIIVGVAQRLQAKLRAADIVARFGGDEFAVLQSGVNSPSDCEVLAERLLAALRLPFDIGGEQAFIGASIGISLCPRDSVEREELMRCADLALYNAKKAGRNRYSFFEDDLATRVEQQRTIEEELRIAVNREMLEIHYQPIVSIDGRKLMAVESLVRWRHPTKGMIPPSDFIGVAERRGMILQLGEFVLRRACQEARSWPQIRVAVNVSAIQFRHPNFVATVQRILNETGLDPARLELELTESIVVDDADAAETAMMDLRALGIRLALDDFGTGYSSLIYLRRFAFDKIKIDKSFLETMEATGESAIIVHSVVHLGRSLGLTVVAEGVETSEQHRFLQALGAHELQGYMFSKAVPAEEISRICANGFVMPPPRPYEFPGAEEPLPLPAPAEMAPPALKAAGAA